MGVATPSTAAARLGQSRHQPFREVGNEKAHGGVGGGLHVGCSRGCVRSTGLAGRHGQGGTRGAGYKRGRNGRGEARNDCTGCRRRRRAQRRELGHERRIHRGKHRGIELDGRRRRGEQQHRRRRAESTALAACGEGRKRLIRFRHGKGRPRRPFFRPLAGRGRYSPLRLHSAFPGRPAMLRLQAITSSASTRRGLDQLMMISSFAEDALRAAAVAAPTRKTNSLSERPQPLTRTAARANARRTPRAFMYDPTLAARATEPRQRAARTRRR